MEKPNFECQKCGYCCHQHGKYQYIYVTPTDVRRIASHLSLRPKIFRETYTKELPHGVVLNFVMGNCVFYDEKKGCTVHPVKPRQCATWPYWPDNIEDGQFKPGVLKICKGCSAASA
jgi:Fe-S-cluster containining protein